MTHSKPLITPDDLERMLELGIERHGPSSNLWSTAAPIDPTVVIADRGYESDEVWAELYQTGSSISRSFPCCKDALDCLPAMRRALDALAAIDPEKERVRAGLGPEGSAE